MSAYIYIEGGGDSKELRTRCREGFRKLLERCGFKGKMPRLVACGGRGAAFDDFATAHGNARAGDFIALWIDSEAPMRDIERAWHHLKAHDDWNAPAGSNDEQVLLMVTCMETWIVADRPTLKSHYGKNFKDSRLPARTNMEKRKPDEIQNRLVNATQNCKNAYAKGRRSFEILGKLDPDELQRHLPSFARCKRILKVKL